MPIPPVEQVNATSPIQKLLQELYSRLLHYRKAFRLPFTGTGDVTQIRDFSKVKDRFMRRLNDFLTPLQ